MRPRVMIVDDNAKIRKLVSEIIRPECRVMRVVSDGPGAIVAVLRHCPDVILLDVFMPGFDGIQVPKRICTLRTNCKVVMLTFVEDRSYVSAALDSGAAGYVFQRSMATVCLVQSAR